LRSAASAIWLASLCVWVLAGCAGTPREPGPGVEDAEAAVDSAAAEPPSADPAAEPIPDGDGDGDGDGSPEAAADGQPGEDVPLLDRTQFGVYSVVNSTSRWFDGFFGSADINANPEEDVRRGLLAIGTRWDERDFDTRVRFRAQFPLPALKQRTRLLLGRGDTEDIVDGSETETINTLPEQFSDFTDDDWLLGLGYRDRSGYRNGYDFGIGVSIRSSQLDPYTRVTYRWNKVYGESWYWRLRPRIFWQESRGEGASVNSILDYVINPDWMLRSWATLITDQEIEGMGWTTDFLAYQSIDDKNAMSYRAYATGETGNEVELQDYGVEIRYRRRILREWLFLELSTGVSWPREFLDEERSSNFGVGLELEMQFGDWPGREQQEPPRSPAAVRH
jgi:hypothetical protein